MFPEGFLVICTELPEEEQRVLEFVASLCDREVHYVDKHPIYARMQVCCIALGVCHVDDAEGSYTRLDVLLCNPSCRNHKITRASISLSRLCLVWFKCFGRVCWNFERKGFQY